MRAFREMGDSKDYAFCKRWIQRGGDVWAFVNADIRACRGFPLRHALVNPVGIGPVPGVADLVARLAAGGVVTVQSLW